MFKSIVVAHDGTDCSEERGADLILVGTHGRRGFDRFLAPSVSERVARDARIPLLIIPTESPASA